MSSRPRRIRRTYEPRSPAPSKAELRRIADEAVRSHPVTVLPPGHARGDLPASMLVRPETCGSGRQVEALPHDE